MSTAWKVSDIAGSEVYDSSGTKLGVLEDVLPTSGNDVWVIKSCLSGTNEILIPALCEVVKEVDVKNKKIIVSLPAGLKEVYEQKK